MRRDRRDDDEDRKPKVPKECPWCGSTRKRPRNHKQNGTCNEQCSTRYAHYRELYPMRELGRSRR